MTDHPEREPSEAERLQAEYPEVSIWRDLLDDGRHGDWVAELHLTLRSSEVQTLRSLLERAHGRRHDMSSMRQARLDRGWSEAEAAALVRALCRSGDQCGMTADRLRDFELGIRHPGPAHTEALSRLYGLDISAQTSDQTEE